MTLYRLAPSVRFYSYIPYVVCSAVGLYLATPTLLFFCHTELHRSICILQVV